MSDNTAKNQGVSKVNNIPIIVRLRGGLGNQLFQYAVGKVVAKSNNKKLLLDIQGYEAQAQGDTPRAYRLHFFNTDAGIASDEEIQKGKYPLGFASKLIRAFNHKVLKKHFTDYHPEVFNGNKKYLDGFFQSEKYFKSIRSEIINDFKLKEGVTSPRFEEVKKMIDEAGEKSVSFHVRRGDYFSNPRNKLAHGVILDQYYKKAIEVILEKVSDPEFFVFSDDIEWVKSNMSIPGKAYYVSAPLTDYSNLSTDIKVIKNKKSLELEDYEELTLMSFCKHNIIANSSFSWWGAWLNQNPNKITLAPRQWTIKNTEHADIYAENWIVIDC